MLSPATRRQRTASRLLPARVAWLSAALLASLGCANIAGFDDFKGPQSGGTNGTSEDTRFHLLQGGTSSTGGMSAVILTAAGGTTTTATTGAGGSQTGGAGAGGAGTGGAGTGGTSAVCGGLNQDCCSGQTCTAPNTVCNATNNTCEACGANLQRCCDATERCSNGCCAANRCVAINQTCGGMNNSCRYANYCANCGREGLACCGQPAANGSCDYGLTCNAGNCRTQ